MIAAFTQHLLLKGTAVFLAVVLWFVVNAKEPQIELVGVRFTPSLLDSSLVLREPLPQIQAIIAGAPKELIRLSSTPPVIHRQITANSPDTVVLDLRPEDVVLPTGVDAVVRDVQPRSLTLRFEPTWNRKVPVVPMRIEIMSAPATGSNSGYTVPVAGRARSSFRFPPSAPRGSRSPIPIRRRIWSTSIPRCSAPASGSVPHRSRFS